MARQRILAGQRITNLAANLIITYLRNLRKHTLIFGILRCDIIELIWYDIILRQWNDNISLHGWIKQTVINWLDQSGCTLYFSWRLTPNLVGRSALQFYQRDLWKCPMNIFLTFLKRTKKGTWQKNIPIKQKQKHFKWTILLSLLFSPSCMYSRSHTIIKGNFLVLQLGRAHSSKTCSFAI